MSDNKTVLVGCRMPGGVSLHVMKRLDREPNMLEMSVPVEDMGYIDLPGFTPPRTESFTSVDAAMWGAWWADNEKGSLATSGMVFDADNAAKDAADKAKAEADKAKVADAPKAEPAKAPAPAAATPAPASTPAPAAK